MFLVDDISTLREMAGMVNAMALWVLLNNFLHDFSAAGWIFAAIVLWTLLREGGRDEPLDGAILRADVYSHFTNALMAP